MKFLALFLVFLLSQVLASQDIEGSHDAVVQGPTVLPNETTPNIQQQSPPGKPEKLLPWPFNALLPRRLRRISFRKLTVYILKQPIRLVRHLYHLITKRDKEEDSKRTVATPPQ